MRPQAKDVSTRKKMKRNLATSISMQPSEICSGPRCWFACNGRRRRRRRKTAVPIKTTKRFKKEEKQDRKNQPVLIEFKQCSITLKVLKNAV